MKERKFTKDRPCSKIEIWNAFYGPGAQRAGGVGATDIVRARAIIGRHVPRALVMASRAHEMEKSGEHLLVLTAVGDEWLKKGIRRYLLNHPERLDEAENLPVRLRKSILKTVAK